MSLHGVTSSVYKCDYGGKVVALKMYKADVSMRRMELANKEKDVLQQLEGVPGVPSCAGVADDGNFLVIFPVGKRIETSVPKGARKHLAGIVDTLEAAHSKGIVHRDVRLGNVVLVDGPSFLLIDWAFSCCTGSSVIFHGSLLTASKEVLMQYIENRSSVLCLPEDDLVSYVKSLYLLSQPTFDRKLRGVQLAGAGDTVARASEVLDLWEEELKGCRDWCKAISLAEKRNYHRLAGMDSELGIELLPLL